MFKPILTAIILSAGLAHAAVEERLVEYKAGDTLCEGVAITDSNTKENKPGVLIVHQWTGISDHEKEAAKRLAAMGYSVFLADVYGKGIRPPGPPASAQEAGKYKKDRVLLRTRLKAALAELHKLPGTDTSRCAALGYCFGGTAVIELARSGADIKVAVSFHGGLDSPTPEDGKNIRCPILALHGADDPFVPPADVEAFETELKAANVTYELIKYPGAVHSFTHKAAGNDPTKGAAYQKEADEKSWAAMVKALEAAFTAR
jgi:dienelactone hydrolase